MHYDPDIILYNESSDVKSLDFSPEGSLLASAHSDFSIRVCYPMIDKELWRFEMDWEEPHVVRFSPDSRFLATAGWELAIHVLDVRDGKRKEISTSDYCHYLRFNPASGLLAAVNNSGTCTFWDPDSLEYSGGLDFYVEVNDFTFSPDGTLLAVCQGSEVQIWDVVREGLSISFQGHQAVVEAAVFSPDGRYVASGDSSGTLIFWDVHTLKRSWTTAPNNGAIRSLAFHRSGKRIAVAYDNRMVQLLDRRTGDVEVTLFFPDDISELCFSYPDRCLAVAGDGSLRIWYESSTQSGHDRFSGATAEGWVKPLNTELV